MCYYFSRQDEKHLVLKTEPKPYGVTKMTGYFDFYL